MAKKAQVTIFIIIALVLMVMFGLTYYVIGSTAERKAEENIVTQQISASKIEPFKEFISSCLSLASSEGLELIGNQGGYIYMSQGGIVNDPLPSELGTTIADYEQNLVRYGINKPLSDVGVLFFSAPPEYPWPTYPRLYHPITGEYRIENKGYFGRNKIPPFNKTQENSIPEQLERFTTNAVLDCADWTIFNQRGLNITSGIPNVSILFAEADITFTLNWEIEVKDLATGSITNLDQFVVVHQIRMKKILDFVELITEADVIDPEYDIQASDGLITAFRTSGIYGDDDLISIRDSESMVFDGQYEFRFMRQNRIPALHFTENITVTVCNSTNVENPAPNQIRVKDACGEDTYTINFTAVDPDEDILNFTFNKDLPHEITPLEATIGEFRIKVTVSDGQYEDSQEIIIPVERSD